MAYGDSDNEVSDSDNYTFDELLNDFQKLSGHYDKLNEKYKSLRKTMDSSKVVVAELNAKIDALLSETNKLKYENASIITENKNLVQNNDKLISENHTLKNKTEDLHMSLKKFVGGTDRLDAILGSQSKSFRKEGIGYIPPNKHVCSSIHCSEHAKSPAPFIKCHFCARKGHTINSCWYRKNIGKVKLIWVPKGTAEAYTNTIGPKKNWVPPFKK
jgi:FtsZ-binding cell division protein ZapB